MLMSSCFTLKANQKRKGMKKGHKLINLNAGKDLTLSSTTTNLMHIPKVLRFSRCWERVKLEECMV